MTDGSEAQDDIASVVADPAWRVLADMHVKFRKDRRVLMKPLLNGSFGGGAWCLASMTWSVSGLHTVSYFVIHEPSSLILGTRDTKAGALAAAREFLADPWKATVIAQVCAKIVADRQREADEQQARIHADNRELARQHPPRVASVPRRRRAIFEKSGGKCHYCACELTIEGRWHIEHKIPRALGGKSVEDNLVASCAPCNHRKLDKTDHEFIASREGAKE